MIGYKKAINSVAEGLLPELEVQTAFVHFQQKYWPTAHIYDAQNSRYLIFINNAVIKSSLLVTRKVLKEVLIEYEKKN